MQPDLSSSSTLPGPARGVADGVTGGPPQPARAARWQGAALLVLVGLVLYLSFRVLLPFFGPILMAVVSGGLLMPWHQRLTRFLGGRPKVSAALLCVGMVVVVLGPLFATLASVSREAARFYEFTRSQLSEERLREHLEERRQSLESISAITAPLGVDVRPESLYPALTRTGVKLGELFYRQGMSLAKRLVRLALSFVLWVVILFYVLLDGERLMQWFEETLPLPAEQQRLVVQRFADMTKSLLVGNGVAGIIQGVGGGLMLLALGLPAPVLWGVVMGILAFLPVIGISFVYIPGFFILLVTGETVRAFLFLIPLMVLATLVEYVWKPAAVGRRMHMHTAMVLLAILGGFYVWGPLGVLVGPLVMTALLTVATIYRESWRNVSEPDAARSPDGSAGAAGAISGCGCSTAAES